MQSSPNPVGVDRLPPTIPDYELLERIGSGANGEVWLARNLATNSRRAIKIVHRSTFTDERPFNREFEGIKKFESISHSHPSQLALFHVGRNNEAAYFYYVMELADALPIVGDDVRSLTSTGEKSEPPDVVSYKAHTLRADLNHSRLPAPRVLEIALTLTEALSHLHAQGLIHRDVKPSNIIFIQGRPKLADIGLVTDATDSRSIVGTEGYLPAEGPGTPAADLFALGKVLYEALTALDRRQYPELPADLRAWPDAQLAFELNTILLKLCAPHPRDRYPTADALLADLKLLDAGKSVQRRQSLKRTLRWGCLAFVACAILAGGFWLFRRELANRAASAQNNLSPAEKSGTTNIAAWQARERAGVMSSSLTAASFSNSVLEYERAISLDPNYAVAWLGLSSRFFLAVQHGHLPGIPTLERARACALKSIELDTTGTNALAGGQFMLGDCILAIDYDLTQAEPLMRKAIQASPRTMAYQVNLATRLWPFGRFAEAETILKEMIQQNPSQANPHNVLGQIYLATRRYPEAIAAFGDAIGLKTDRPDAYFERATALWLTNQRDAAARDWLRFVEMGAFLPLSTPQHSSILREAMLQRGPDGLLRQLIDELERSLASGQFISSYDLSRLHALERNKDRALDYLEKAVGEHRPLSLATKVTPIFDFLRDEPRFHALLRKMKLE